MSFNPHRQVALEFADRWLDDLGGISRIAEAFRLTRAERLEVTMIVDAFGQPFKSWDMGQLFSLACLHHLSMRGKLVVAEHYIGAAPKKDRYRQENEEALRRQLGPGTSIEVDLSQSGAEMDGLLSWDKAIPATGRSGGIDIAPGSAPLEIGYTDASTTCLHLGRFGAVARWPYGHDTLRVFATEPRDLIQSVRTSFEQTGEDPVLEDLGQFVNAVWFGWYGLGPVTSDAAPSSGLTRSMDSLEAGSHQYRRNGTGVAVVNLIDPLFGIVAYL